MLVDLFNQIRKKLVIFVHFKGFNISQKPKSSPLWYFAQKTSLNLAPNWYPIVFTGIGQTLMSRPVCVSCSTQNLYKMAPYNVQEQGEIISKIVWTINKNKQFVHDKNAFLLRPKKYMCISDYMVFKIRVK